MVYDGDLPESSGTNIASIRNVNESKTFSQQSGTAVLTHFGVIVASLRRMWVELCHTSGSDGRKAELRVSDRQ